MLPSGSCASRPGHGLNDMFSPRLTRSLVASNSFLCSPDCGQKVCDGMRSFATGVNGCLASSHRRQALLRSASLMVVRTDRDVLRRFRSATRSAANQFDLSFVDDVGREWRETSVFA